MSILKQPPLILPFWESTGLMGEGIYGENVGFKDRGDCVGCCNSVVAPVNSFVPFIILTDSDDFQYGRIMNMDDTLYTDIIMAFGSYLDDETGLYVNYYNGMSLGVPCGSYYLMISFGGIWYYSEPFRIISNSELIGTIPVIVYDEFHLPLRVFDTLIKQYHNKCDDECNVTPISDRSSILPFLFEPDVEIELDDIITTLVHCNGVELDISSEVDYIISNSDPTTTSYKLKISTSTNMKNLNYKFDSNIQILSTDNPPIVENGVFQQIMVGDTGYLNKIEFDYYYGGEAVPLRIKLILGKNPMTAAIHTYDVTDTAPAGKTIVVDYSAENIYLHANDHITLRIERLDECHGYMPIWWTQIYPYGKFGKINGYGTYKEFTSFDIVGNSITGSSMYGALDPNDDLCYGTLTQATAFDTFNYYEADEDHTINWLFENIRVALTGPGGADFIIRKNGALVYSESLTFPGMGPATGTFATYTLTDDLENGDIIWIQLTINGASGLSYTAGEIIRNDIDNDVSGLPGVNYANATMCFVVWMNKEIYSGGTGTDYLYQTGRLLSQLLNCGVYYIKIEMGGETWYTDRFKVVNIGELESPNDIDDATTHGYLSYEEDWNDLVEYEQGGNIEIN